MVQGYSPCGEERGDQLRRHIEMRMQRVWFILALLAASLPPSLVAGAIKVWHMAEVEQSPVLIVGRVGPVRKEFQVPSGTLPWNAETWAMATDVEVIRSYSSSGQVLTPGSTVGIRFFAYGPSQKGFINGSPPPLVSLRPGEVVLIPLQTNESPAKDAWMLLGKEGVGLTIPVRGTIDETLPQPRTGHQFILREIANSLCNGTIGETSSAGGYVHDQYQNLTSELMPLLTKTIRADKRRWAAVLVDLMGVQRPGLKDLRAGDLRDVNWNPSADQGYSIASAILKQMPDTPEFDRLMIDALMERVSVAPDFASFLAGDYVENDYFIFSLRAALDRHQPGSVYVASNLIDRGHKSFLPYALAAAREIVSEAATTNPTYADRCDKEAATFLLR